MHHFRIILTFVLALLVVAAPAVQLAGCAVTRAASEVDVRMFGAKGDGTTNDTAAFTAAINTLGAAGGTVNVPAGKYAVNLVITQPNIRIVGTASTSNVVNNALVPFSTSSPVVQVGDDSDYVKGVQIHNLTFNAAGPSGSGQTGLYLFGGAYQTFLTNLTFNGFTQNCVKLKGGATYPVSFAYFNGLTTNPATGVGANQAGFKVEYGATYATAVYLTNANLHPNANTGYALELDSAQLYVTNAWIEAADGHGVKFTKTYASLPKLICANVAVDSASSLDSLVETYNTDNNLGSVMTGEFTVDGLFKLSSSATVKIENGSIPSRTKIFTSMAIGSMAFADTGTAWASSTAYGVGTVVVNSENVYKCTTAGTSAGSGGPTGTGATIADGTAVWAYQHGLNDYSANHKMYASSGSLWVETTGNLRLVPNSGATFHTGLLDSTTFRLASGPTITSGTGSPEGAETAPISSLYFRTDGSTATAIYVKETGSGSTGWKPVVGDAVNKSSSESIGGGKTFTSTANFSGHLVMSGGGMYCRLTANGFPVRV